VLQTQLVVREKTKKNKWLFLRDSSVQKSQKRDIVTVKGMGDMASGTAERVKFTWNEKRPGQIGVGNHAYNGTVEVSRCCDDFNILGDRDFGRPPAPVVKCHIWGAAVLKDMLKASFQLAFHCSHDDYLSFPQNFERRQGHLLSPQVWQRVQLLFNKPSNVVLSTLVVRPPSLMICALIHLQVTYPAIKHTTGHSGP
jgi:hypothetical protein